MEGIGLGKANASRLGLPGVKRIQTGWTVGIISKINNRKNTVPKNKAIEKHYQTDKHNCFKSGDIPKAEGERIYLIFETA